MSDDLLGVIITALVTSAISIIGFVVTNLTMKRNFQNELIRQRDNVSLEKMSSIPYEILSFMDKIIENKSVTNKELGDFKRLMNEIYSYGSEKAISLVALMQKENYAANADSNKINKFRVMSTYILLATQIKYDVTGVYVNPELWFRMRITDYDNNKLVIMRENNKLVNELNLCKKMKIKAEY